MIRRGVPVRRVGDRLVTTVYDLLLAQYGVGREGLPGEWGGGYDDASSALHPGVAGGDHLASPPETVKRIAREFAANAEESGGRSTITLGAGTNHWAPLRRDLPRDHRAGGAHRLPGQERLGALRRPGEGATVHRLGAAGIRPRLGAPAALQMGGHVVLVPPHRPVALRRLRRRGRRRPRLGSGILRRSGPSPTPSRRPCGWGGRRSPPTFDRNPLHAGRGRREGRDVTGGLASPPQLKAGRLKFAVEDPDAPENFPLFLRPVARTCSARRARATKDSGTTCSAPTGAIRQRGEPPRACARRT